MELFRAHSNVSRWVQVAVFLVAALVPGEVHLLVALEPGVRFELIHRDNPSSPLHKADLSFSERVSLSLRRSMDQRNAFKNGKQSNIRSSGRFLSAQTTYESPVAKRNVSWEHSDYTMEITLGSPPQKFIAIVDTGSDLTWVQCKPCAEDQCFKQPNALFDPSTSSSYHTLKCDDKRCRDLVYSLPCEDSPGGDCQYVLSYGDSSRTRGNISLETITLTTSTGSQAKFDNFAFGCGHRNQGTFEEADGLVGLGQGPESFPNQLGSAMSNKFSTCFVPFADRGSKASEIIFGEGAAAHFTEMRYTPFVYATYKERFSTTPYLLNLTGMSVEGKKLDIPSEALQNPGTMIDSGTTYTLMGSGIFKPVVQAVAEVMDYPQLNTSSDPDFQFELCYNLSGVQNPKLPNATFHFIDADYEIPPDNLFVRVDEAGLLCLAMINDDAITIIGNYQTQNVHVLYDRQQKRLGFAPAECGS
ncbi:hypothetical protein Mapa_000096 [Marchantia paleacea]|nr:hypothetical protein Mapa_000096 [Marchantia paleacea]